MIPGVDASKLVFLAISVDDKPRRAKKIAFKRWPNLQHAWIDTKGIVAAGITFVPNRAILRGRDGFVSRWWDGTGGRVLNGPHGASRSNGSRDLILEISRGVTMLKEDNVTES